MVKRRNQIDDADNSEHSAESTPMKKHKSQLFEGDALNGSVKLDKNLEIKKHNRSKKNQTVANSTAKKIGKHNNDKKKLTEISKKSPTKIIVSNENIDQKREKVIEEVSENSDDEIVQTIQNKSSTFKKFDFNEFSATPDKSTFSNKFSDLDPEGIVDPEKSKEEEKKIEKTNLPSGIKKKRGRAKKIIQEKPSDVLSANKQSTIVDKIIEEKLSPEEKDNIKSKEPIEKTSLKKNRQARESAAKNSEEQTEKKKRGRKPKQIDQSIKNETKIDNIKSEKVKPNDKAKSVIDEAIVEKSDLPIDNQIEDSEEIKQKNSTSNTESEQMNKKIKKNFLKVISFNVNGIRACLDKGLIDFLNKENADIFCLQELKCNQKKIPQSLKEIKDYFYYWNVPNDKDGYSGVAIFSKIEPLQVIYDMGDNDFHGEGRSITCEYDNFFLVNVYATNAGRGLPRLKEKRDWNEAFRKHLIKLDKEKPVIACGDFNCAHNEIDLENPKSNTKTAGFTPEEREDFSHLLDSGFFDSYRYLNPNKIKAYTFWSYMRNAREKDIGWRLDYFILSNRLKTLLIDNVINNDIFGSDHCPITLTIDI